LDSVLFLCTFLVLLVAWIVISFAWILHVYYHKDERARKSECETVGNWRNT
jgi:hypothetical protein